MDSMRSLNTSLPASSPHPSRSQPPEQLLQAFKTAALSVTNLYKNAVSDQAQARHLGYQEALEDLRAFLDRERIGVDDGEGLKIRNWVVDRIDGSAAGCESEDERGEHDKRSRSLSPAATRKESPETHPQNHQSRSASPPRQEADPQPNNNNHVDSYTVPRAPSFTFSAGPQYPTFPQQQDIDMQANDVLPTSTMSTQTDAQISNPSNMSTSPSVRVEVVPRGSRTPHRPNNGNRHISRSSARDPSFGAGSKRKFHFGDFFDISSLGNGKDMFGGGKRGRYL